MSEPVKLLQIVLDETDVWDETPLYKAIVTRLSQLGVSGATVQVGTMGFGRHREVHGKHLFGISDDRPVIISVIDLESNLRRILPEIRPMVQEGLMLLLDVERVQ